MAVLPLAATEQHGPHLPTGTDTFIAEGLIAEASRHVSDDMDLVVLPTQAIGASLEHARFPGTLSVSAAALTTTIISIGESVRNAGLEKLVIVSAHGGNVAAMTSAALECRARFGLLAVTLTFARLGLPPGLVEPDEVENGVHAGLDRDGADAAFPARARRHEQGGRLPIGAERLSANDFKRLRAYGPVGFGWLAGDLNRDGAAGNAAAATAEIGAAIAEHQAQAPSRNCWLMSPPRMYARCFRTVRGIGREKERTAHGAHSSRHSGPRLGRIA